MQSSPRLCASGNTVPSNAPARLIFEFCEYQIWSCDRKNFATPSPFHHRYITPTSIVAVFPIEELAFSGEVQMINGRGAVWKTAWEADGGMGSDRGNTVKGCPCPLG